MAKIKGLFFDIDDTLYDSTKLATTARKNAISAMIDAGLPEKDEKKVYQILERIIKRVGSNYPQHYDELLKEIGKRWDPKIIASGVVAYEHTKRGHLTPFPQVEPTLQKMKKKYRLGIISNGLAIKQWEKLIGLGLNNIFDIVVTSEEVGFEKPDVRIFERAIKKMGLKPEECIMVGDKTDIDVEGAKESGMHTVLVKGNKKLKSSVEAVKPDYYINEISELKGILENLG